MNPIVAVVTGANGYIGSWIVKGLLQRGMEVRACVRNHKDPSKVAHLQALGDQSHGTLRLYSTDLLTPNSYSTALNGADLLFHCASPFKLRVDDVQRELIEPAVTGTQNLLQQVNQSSSLQRVVLTSSVAAICGDNADLQSLADKTMTETNWNRTSSPTHQPYSYSKTEAEKVAWQCYNEQSRWELLVINPSLVVGPAINPKANFESMRILKYLMSGTFQQGIPALEFGTVDVRDVAEAHILAALATNGQGRHIISERTMSMAEMAEILRRRYGNQLKLPERVLPKSLVYILGPVLDKTVTRRYVQRNVGYPWRASNEKSITALGLDYRPTPRAIIEMAEQLINTGRVKLNP